MRRGRRKRAIRWRVVSVEALRMIWRPKGASPFQVIDSMGGMIAAIRARLSQRESAESAYRLKQDVEARRRVIVGVNDFVTRRDDDPAASRRRESAADVQLPGSSGGGTRDNDKVARTLDALRRAAEGRRGRKRCRRCSRPYARMHVGRDVRCGCATSGRVQEQGDIRRAGLIEIMSKIAS